MIQSRLTRNNLKEFGTFSYPVLGNDLSQMEAVKNADIIYIHWVMGGFFNLKSIDQLARLGKPIVFFMHDMWTFTGGCHYSFTCEKYTTGCINCQVIPGEKRWDLSAKEFEKKLKLFKKYDNLYFSAPSRWLYECAKKALLTINKPVFYIPNILDSTVYKPFDKKIAKQILNIDKDETVIAFGAVSVTSPYKGWSYLQKAIELLQDYMDIEKTTLLIFGKDGQEIANGIKFKTKFMGYLKDEYSTVLVYNAADVFIAPSLAETFGYTIYEALSCGTPVVGFDTGGIRDLIKHKVNGYVAKYRDANDIAEGIKFCLENNIIGHPPVDINTNSTINKHLELFNYVKPTIS
jgi:glycosyltransferase involved in cell wall biosynthesis